MADPPSDPFEAVRDEQEYRKPVDEQNETMQAETYSLIRQQYHEYATPVAPVHSTKLEAKWFDITFKALFREPEFWKLCLDNAVGLFVTKPPKVFLLKEWVAGIYLPEFYTHYGTLEEGFTDYFGREGRDIVEQAESAINSLLQSSEQTALKAKPSATSSVAVKIGEIDEHMIALAQLVKQEKREDSCRNRLAMSIRDLGSLLPMLPNVEALGKKYLAASQEEFQTSLDIFGSECLAALKPIVSGFQIDLKPMGLLTDEEEKLLAQATSSDVIIGETHQHKQKSQAGKKHRRYRVGEKKLNVLDDPPAQYEWLSEIFENEEDDRIFYPAWTPLTGPPFRIEHVQRTQLGTMPGFTKTRSIINADEAVEQAQCPTGESALKKIWKRSKSFKQGRMISNKELEEGMPDPTSLVEKCTATVVNMIKHSNQPLWSKLCTQLANITKREERAVGEAASSSWQTYTEMAFYDNWYHVRKLMQALHSLMDPVYRVQDFEVFEKDMIVVLAATQGACPDPLPFMVSMDSVLRKLWRMCIKWRGSYQAGEDTEKEKTWALIKNVFDELALFAQGATIYAAVLRFRYTGLFKDSSIPGNDGQYDDTSRLFDWYRSLYAYDPTCGQPDCNRLLPSPSTMRTEEFVKNHFSVATRDVRAGKKGVRRFISTNRVDCYPCFMSCVQSRKVTPMLVAIFFYYSFIFHSIGFGCKPARGSRSIPGLA